MAWSKKQLYYGEQNLSIYKGQTQENDPHEPQYTRSGFSVEELLLSCKFSDKGSKKKKSHGTCHHLRLLQLLGRANKSCMSRADCNFLI